MSEQTKKTESVTTSSDGNVKISLERYNQLVKEASAEKFVQNIYTTKTDKQQAMDNQMWGALWGGLGLATTVLGGIAVVIGRRQEKRLKNRR